jgi:hypothetical protein
MSGHYLVEHRDLDLPYQFWTACDGLSREQLPLHTDMLEKATEITHRSFRAAVDSESMDSWAREHSYDTGHERGGLRLSNDWHVAYYRSWWQGERCYYFVWSAYEIIFRRGGV